MGQRLLLDEGPLADALASTSGEIRRDPVTDEVLDRPGPLSLGSAILCRPDVFWPKEVEEADQSLPPHSD